MFEATESNYFRPRLPIILYPCVSTKGPGNRSLHFRSRSRSNFHYFHSRGNERVFDQKKKKKRGGTCLKFSTLDERKRERACRSAGKKQAGLFRHATRKINFRRPRRAREETSLSHSESEQSGAKLSVQTESARATPMPKPATQRERERERFVPSQGPGSNHSSQGISDTAGHNGGSFHSGK